MSCKSLLIFIVYFAHDSRVITRNTSHMVAPSVVLLSSCMMPDDHYQLSKTQSTKEYAYVCRRRSVRVILFARPHIALFPSPLKKVLFI